ncbi:MULTISPECIES: shikimate kinase [Weissella]|uniref:Shikimate kinase n=1 Tax=Weissella thailandensis TaxID=89061 RepID=A0ABX9I4C1_9LACO|nr:MULTISPECIES: shikimate kinase [Weissella]NKY90935.1 shikimate kinase [Weissella thailandensis]RDS59563.1 shikimate kinase [Weissella thailandensis]GEP74864.1 shikimate kinase [Weissella thailandensis]HJG85170.1 shikimate kinase [Weissella thailandensis]
MKVILIGFMGAGKTTVGQLLAEKTTLPFFDTDQLIVTQTGQTPGEIFAIVGELGFRQLEQTILQENLTKSGIMATGGGIIELEQNRQLLKSSPVPVIYLSGSFGQTVERLVKDNTRPIVRNKSLLELAELWEQRLKKYSSIATEVIYTDNKTADQVAEEVLQYMRAFNDETTENR